MNCKIEGCLRNCKYKKYQYCNLHYQRWRRFGDPGTDLKSQIRDGHINDYAYKSWASMKTRCLNDKNDAYSDYGGRGITICNEWLDFHNFLNDMGARPKNTTLERLNNDGNYEPGNCVWATRLQQNNNRRNNVLITIDGITKPISVWARENDISYYSIIQRLRRGWSGRDLLKNTDARYRHTITTPLGNMTVKELSEYYKISSHLIYQRLDRGLSFKDLIAEPYSLR